MGVEWDVCPDAEGSEKEMIWSVSEEVAFLKASLHCRPVGIKKHWEMAALVHNMQELLGRSIAPEICWKHLETLFSLEGLDEREELPFSNDKEAFSLPSDWDLTKGTDKDWDNEEKIATPKVVKDYTRVREKKTPITIKTEPKLIKVEKEDSPNESDEEDSPLIAPKTLRKSRASDVKKSNTSSAKKRTPKRGSRHLKDEKRDASPAITKKDEDSKGSSKKDANNLGKRTLRSRGDDDGSYSPAPTPPPTKRARRF